MGNKRRKILKADIASRVRDIVREECRKLKVEILKGHISSDHVHILVSIPPQVTISHLIQKGKSAYILLGVYPFT